MRRRTNHARNALEAVLHLLTASWACPKYSDIRHTCTVDCDAREAVDELCAHVQRTSSVMDILGNPVAVEVRRRP